MRPGPNEEPLDLKGLGHAELTRRPRRQQAGGGGRQDRDDLAAREQPSASSSSYQTPYEPRAQGAARRPASAARREGHARALHSGEVVAQGPSLSHAHDDGPHHGAEHDPGDLEGLVGAAARAALTTRLSPARAVVAQGRCEAEEGPREQQADTLERQARWTTRWNCGRGQLGRPPRRRPRARRRAGNRLGEDRHRHGAGDQAADRSGAPVAHGRRGRRARPGGEARQRREQDRRDRDRTAPGSW